MSSSELYQYLTITSLNKNTANLIIEYLTDPPALPFLSELNYKFNTAIFAINSHWFYQNRTVYFAGDYSPFRKHRSTHVYTMKIEKSGIYIVIKSILVK